MISPLRLISMTLKSLRIHIFRVILASLGVVLGVGSVVGMTSISEGARQASLDQLKSLGINNVLLTSQEVKKTLDNISTNSKLVTYGITRRDIERIQKFENTDRVIPIRNLDQKVYFRGMLTDINLYATTEGFLDVSYSELVGKESRFFNYIDIKKNAKVCVVGEDAARVLFSYNNPIGKLLNIGKSSYKVVGVIRNRYGYEVGDLRSVNKQVFIPYSTGVATYGERILDTSNWKFNEVYAHKVIIRVKDVKSLENTSARIKNFLKVEHSEKDYRITVPLELVNQQEKTQKVFTIVMGSIAAISLLVGGIGIMNIMLANIYERTKEIGTRRALGATQSDIVLQFLSESTIMTGLGGSIGIVLGFVIASIVEKYGGMQTIISMHSLVLSFTVAVGTGILFGTYPAYQASKLEPVIALRSE